MSRHSGFSLGRLSLFLFLVLQVLAGSVFATTFQGILREIRFTDPELGTETSAQVLQTTDGSVYYLRWNGDARDLVIPPNSQIIVNASRDASQLLADPTSLVIQVPRLSVQPSHTGPQKTVVALYNYSDQRPSPIELVGYVNQLRTDVYTGTLSVNNYYKEISFNQISVTGS